jgi:hypothetical protein
MYIDEDKKFIFFSVPKVGSSSLLETLDSNAYHSIYERLQANGVFKLGWDEINHQNIWTSAHHLTYPDLKVLLPGLDLN